MLANPPAAVAYNRAVQDQPDILLFRQLLKCRDECTANHCVRVAECVAAIATHLDIDSEQADEMVRGALLHDVGKLPSPYWKAVNIESASEELLRNAGRQFDPDLVGAFVSLFG